MTGRYQALTSAARGRLSGQHDDTLAGRLDGGVVRSARESLVPPPGPVTSLHTPAVDQALAGLWEVTRLAEGLRASEVDALIGALARVFTAHRPLALTALLWPSRLAELAPGPRTAGGANPVGGWLVTCWITEAVWKALQSDLTDPGYAVGDRELLAPLAARCRFLALSEPMRWRAQPGSPWLTSTGPHQGYPVQRVFGTNSWNDLVGRCREARRAWFACLDAYQSHVYLSQASSAELEEELHALVFRHGRAGSPLGLSVAPLAQGARLTAEDKALIDEVTERHLLPRFDLVRVAALAIHADTHAIARATVGVLAVAAGLAAVGCAASLQLRAAALVSIGCYMVIGIGVIAFGPNWAAPWALRLPAAAGVGLIALISILPGGWLSTPPTGWTAAAVLVLAACGYLVVEARNHRIEGRAQLRALLVATVGAVYALMISLIGMLFMAPAFVSSGSGLATLLAQPGYGHAGMIVLLATAWCLAVGVFSQILWDDRPITAPLAHLSWRSERPT